MARLNLVTDSTEIDAESRRRKSAPTFGVDFRRRFSFRRRFLVPETNMADRKT